MRKRSTAHREHVRAEFKRKVTAKPTRGRKRLKQAGSVYRSFDGRAREALYQLIACVFHLVTKYARSEEAYKRLIQDRYFTRNSRKRPNFESRYSQIMCYVLQAQPGAAREKAQRLGRIIQMLDEQGKQAPAVIGAILALGGVVKAHEEAKRYLASASPTADRAERANLAQRSLDRPSRMVGAERQEDEEAEGDEEVIVSQVGRSPRPAVPSEALRSRPRSSPDDLKLTTSEQDKARVLSLDSDPAWVRLTCRVERDPTRKDGWKIITVEEVEVLD